MNLRDDIFLRSVNWACLALGIPRPTLRYWVYSAVALLVKTWR